MREGIRAGVGIRGTIRKGKKLGDKGSHNLKPKLVVRVRQSVGRTITHAWGHSTYRDPWPMSRSPVPHYGLRSDGIDAIHHP